MIEKLLMTIAHKLPRKLAYWSYIDTTCRFSTDNPTAEVPNIRAVDVIKELT